MLVWLNGRLLPADRARLAVTDHGLTVGDGVFETMKVTAGRAFAQTRHIARLRRSATLLGLPEPDAGTVVQAIAETLDGNRGSAGSGRLRITYTSGDGPPGSDRGPGPGTLIAWLAPAAPRSDTTDIVTVAWPRNEHGPLAGAKTTSYAENVVVLAEAKRRGASEAVMPNTRGELCEGTGSNVFIVRDGVLRTPPLSSGCLAGVTRGLVLEWFGGVEEVLTMNDLRDCDEIFLTSSTREVHPVSRVDGLATSSVRMGSQLWERFTKRSAENPDP